MGTPPTQDEVLTWFDKLSNWGRWGEDDVLATLNYITPEKRKQAASLVKDGFSVSCSRLIPRHDPATALGGSNPTSYMIQSGERYVLGDNPEHPMFPGGKMLEWAAESVSFVFHGMVFTHIDDLGHVFWDGRMYNGRSSGLVKAAEGSTVQSSEEMRDGILTRGILYDIARLKGKKALEPGEHVFPEDLEAFEAQYKVKAEAGDIVLLRTGYGSYIDALQPGEQPPHEHSGWNAACLPWFHERKVAAIGSDVINDATPPGAFNQTILPVHQIALVAMGLRLIDNAHLERLSEACAARNRYEFHFSLNPLRFHNGTGSPANPVATF